MPLKNTFFKIEGLQHNSDFETPVISISKPSQRILNLYLVALGIIFGHFRVFS
jgi:hypothetical protein